MSAYVSGKRGMMAAAQSCREVAPDGITVNQVAPGYTVSERPVGAGDDSYTAVSPWGGAAPARRSPMRWSSSRHPRPPSPPALGCRCAATMSFRRSDARLLLRHRQSRPDRLGCFGHDRRPVRPSTASRLKGRWRHCYATVPCLPSRTALFSGRHGLVNGCVAHGPRARGLRRSRSLLP